MGGKIYVCANVHHLRRAINRKKTERKEKYVVRTQIVLPFFLFMCIRNAVKPYRENKISFKAYCLYVLHNTCYRVIVFDWDMHICYLPILLFSFFLFHVSYPMRKRTINGSWSGFLNVSVTIRHSGFACSLVKQQKKDWKWVKTLAFSNEEKELKTTKKTEKSYLRFYLFAVNYIEIYDKIFWIVFYPTRRVLCIRFSYFECMFV